MESRASRIILVCALLSLGAVSLAACDGETPAPTVSSLPTPPVSPIEPPQAEAVGIVVVEKPNDKTMEETQMSLPEVLSTIAAGTVGGIIAFLFERFKWFQNLSANAKFWAVGVLSMGLPLVSTTLLQYVPADVWVALEPFWQAIAAGGVVWLGSQVAHKFINKGA